MFKTFSKLTFLLPFCPLTIHSFAYPLIIPIYLLPPPFSPFPSSFYLYSPISVPKQNEEQVILAHNLASTFRKHIERCLLSCLHVCISFPLLPPLSTVGGWVYIYMCVCVCLYVWERERKRQLILNWYTLIHRIKACVVLCNCFV